MVSVDGEETAEDELLDWPRGAREEMSIRRVTLAGADNHYISGLDQKTKCSPNHERNEIITGLQRARSVPRSPSRNPQPNTSKPTLNPNRSHPNHDHHANRHPTLSTHGTPNDRPTPYRIGIELHPQTAASTYHEGSYVVFEGLGVTREVGIAAIDRDTESV